MVSLFRENSAGKVAFSEACWFSMPNTKVKKAYAA
jgi:hypothetical protein